jgi:hypothetical protein
LVDGRTRGHLRDRAVRTARAQERRETARVREEDFKASATGVECGGIRRAGVERKMST